MVYAAVGRRLGYPLKLVSTRGKTSGHLFARWDTDRERFNIEASGRGLATPSDDYFRTGLYELGPDIEADGCYLQSKSPRAEISGFLAGRAWRWAELRDWRRGVESLAWAAELAPRKKLTLNSLKRNMVEWDREQKGRKPNKFPLVRVQRENRLFCALPLEVEQDIHGLIATDNVLSDPRLEVKYWGRMRRGDFERVPSKVVATFLPNEACNIDLLFN